MAKGRETLTTTAVGVAITTADTLLLGGPFLGWLGLLLIFFLSSLGWLVGTAAVRRVSIYVDPRAEEYRARLWTVVIVVGIAIFAGVLLYFFLVDSAKSEYSRGDIVIHLGWIFAFATSIRIMVYAAALAIRD